LNIAGHSFDWNFGGTWSRSHDNQANRGNLDIAHVQHALGPVELCTSPCVPLNLFGGPGTITRDMLAFIEHVAKSTSEQTLADVSANVGGELFDLPNGR
jgi:iron complex outermembrane receptor protein